MAMLAVLAGLSIAAVTGLDHWLAALAERPGHPALAAAELAARARELLLQGAAGSAIPLALALAAGLAAARGARVRGLGWMVALLIAADLATSNGRLLQTAPVGFYRQLPAAVQVIRADPRGHARVWSEPEPKPRFPVPLRRVRDLCRWQRESLQYLTGAAYGLDMAFPPDIAATSPLAYAQLQVLMEGAPERERSMLLGAAGVTHVVTSKAIDDLRLEPLAELTAGTGATLRVYRNRLAVDRFRMVPALTPYRGESGFTTALRSAPDDLFAHTALVEERELERLGSRPPRLEGTPGTVEVRRPGARIQGLLTRGDGGWLVISDTLTRGWSARVDGEPVALLRADWAFRALWVPPGEHRVTLDYSPW